MLACIPIPIGLGMVLNSDAGVGLAVLLGFVMFFAGAIVVGQSHPLRPTYIDDNCAKFKGAHSEFLARLKPLTVQPMAARAPGM